MALGMPTVGLIGMGDMGKMYARRISAAGWRYVFNELNITKLLIGFGKLISHLIHIQRNDDLSAFGSSMSCWLTVYHSGA